MPDPLIPRLLSCAKKSLQYQTPWSAYSSRFLLCQPRHLNGRCMKHFNIERNSFRASRGIATSNQRFNTEHDIRSLTEIDRQGAFKQQVFDQSIALSRSRMNDSTELRCSLFVSGNSPKFQETRLTKAEVAQLYGVDGRELRNADLKSQGIPHILVRPSTIFISIFSLRLLVQSDRVLLFLPDAEIDGVRMEDVFEHNLQGKIQAEQGSGFTPSLPFELRVVDAALASITAILEAEHLILQGEVKNRLRLSAKEDLAHLTLSELLERGKKVATIEQRARQFRSALQELLNNDEDLALMYLSDRQAGKPHAIADHQEVEYLLEAYYKNADAIAEAASALVGEVNRTARATESMLDVRRNQIMVFEAQLEIWMLGLAVSTFVAGLIGMNVVNYMEETPYAFAWLVSGCAVATLLIARFGMLKLKKFRKMRF